MMLYYLHVAAFLIHLVSFILSLFCHVDLADSDVLVTKHLYEQDKTTVFSYEKITSFNAVSWISLNEALTCFSHGIALYLLYAKKDSNEINNLEHGRRTVEYAFTAGILACALVLSTGSVFLHDIIFLLGINVALQGIGHLIHKHSHKSMLMYTIGFGLLALEIIYVVMQTSNNSFPADFDDTFFVLMGILFGIMYVLFGVVKFVVEDKNKQDELYVVLSVTTKVVLSWIVISNTHQGFLDLFTEVPEGVIDMDWKALQVTLTIILLVLATILAYYVENRERVTPMAVAVAFKDLKVTRKDLFEKAL